MRIVRFFWAMLTILAPLVVAASAPLYAREVFRSNLMALPPGMERFISGDSFFTLYVLVVSYLPFVAFYGTALVLYWRKPTDRIAVWASIALIGLGLFFCVPLLTLYTVAMEQHQTGLALIPASMQGLGLAAIVIIFYVFPDGRFMPPWTRYAAIAWALFAWSQILVPMEMMPTSVRYVITILAGCTGVYAQYHRYRRVSTPIQRQQAKWVIFGLSVALNTFLLFGLFNQVFFSVAATPVAYLLYLFSLLPVVLAILTIPLSLGFSILEYRLWEIDPLIDRTLAYAFLSGVLTVIYILGVILWQQIFQALTGQAQSGSAAALSTLVVAILFLPLRQRTHRIIRRYLYGEASTSQIATQIATTSHSIQAVGASPPPLVEPLTNRELEVLHLIAAGCSNLEIAERLVITEGTVKQHTTNIYGKLGVRRRTAAVVRAKELGLLR